MALFWDKYKGQIIIAIIIIAVVLTIYFHGKKQGRDKVEGPQVNYPKGGNDIPKGWNPEILAKKLYNSMKGVFSTASAKEKVWSELLLLPTDEMLIAAYNAFNQLYFKEGKGTLTDWIRDEFYFNVIGSVKGDVLNRLERLNLK